MAKRIKIILGFLIIQLGIFAQQKIPMHQEESGIYTIPCEVNGLKLRFVFDTGASDVHLSLLDAAFMLKNGYLSKDDFLGKDSYTMADGSISDNAVVNLKEIRIGNLRIKDVRASISSKINASLLLGQSAIQKIGKYTIDGNYLILHDSQDLDKREKYRVIDNKGDYEGEYKDGLRHGKGICKYPSGNVYDGEWENDKENGYGVYTWPNGDKYDGHFRNGLRNGRGTYTWPSGEKYVGQWLNGKRNGQGTDYYSNGDKYVGNWVDSNREGYGVLYYADGRKYTGSWLKDKMDGNGVFVWPRGDKYEGSFANGYREGEGTYYWHDGAKYVGSWKLGKRNGYGTYTNSDGQKQTGIWTNDVIEEDGLNKKTTPTTSVSNDKYHQNGKYYLAETTTILNLRECPSTNCDILANIPKGSAVFTKIDSNDDFVKILYIDKDLYGYVSKKFLSNFKEVKVDKEGVLKVVGKSNQTYNSEVEIENRTNKHVTINIGSSIYKYYPHEKRTITLSPGTYDITASSPGLLPYIGNDKIDAGKKYSWYFYIKTDNYGK